MNWLSRLIAGAVRACGLEPAGKAGGSIQFFIYDVVKIMLPPGALILLISCIQSYFPPGVQQENPGALNRPRTHPL